MRINVVSARLLEKQNEHNDDADDQKVEPVKQDIPLLIGPPIRLIAADSSRHPASRGSTVITRSSSSNVVVVRKTITKHRLRKTKFRRQIRISETVFSDLSSVIRQDFPIIAMIIVQAGTRTVRDMKIVRNRLLFSTGIDGAKGATTVKGDDGRGIGNGRFTDRAFFGGGMEMEPAVKARPAEEVATEGNDRVLSKVEADMAIKATIAGKLIKIRRNRHGCWCRKDRHRCCCCCRKDERRKKRRS